MKKNFFQLFSWKTLKTERGASNLTMYDLEKALLKLLLNNKPTDASANHSQQCQYVIGFQSY